MNNFNIILAKKMKSLMQSGAPRDLSAFSNIQKKVITIISVVVAFLQVYYVIYAYPDPIFLRSFHACIFVALAIFWFSPNNITHKKLSIFDFILIGFSLATFFYIWIFLIQYFPWIYFLDRFIFYCFLRQEEE